MGGVGIWSLDEPARPELERAEFVAVGITREAAKIGNKNSNSNSNTLFYKDCSLGSAKNLTTSPC